MGDVFALSHTVVDCIMRLGRYGDAMRLDASRLSNVTGKGDIVIVEFTDFQCPFCGKHARDTFPTLRKELIDSSPDEEVVC